MDDSKTPFLPSDKDLPAPSPGPTPPPRTSRTTRAFRLALYIWLAIVFIAALALPKSPCSLHRLREERVQMGRVGEDMTMLGPMEGGRMEGGMGLRMKQRGYKVVEDLPKGLVPHKDGYWGGEGRRLVFVGDVHGSFRPLKELLKKLNYDAKKDHLVFVGDMITRGRKSLEVLNLAMAQNASCVRGNHEDRILLLRKQIEKHPKGSTELEMTSNKKLKSEIKLARKLSKKQVDWLEACPVILNIEDVPGVGHIAAVHAGLRVGVPLEKQDPQQVMNMRSIDPTTGIPTKEKTGRHWATVWNHFQRQSRKPITVVYGHYASAGLDIRRFSMGLDTDCNRQGKLTAFVVDSTKNGGSLVQVDCKKLADKK